MNGYVRNLFLGMFSGLFVGTCVGIPMGIYINMEDNHKLLTKLGIQIIETRVNNGEPVYSYHIVDNKREENK